MKTAIKIWLLVAASLVLAGILLFGGAMLAMNRNFYNLSSSKYETNTYEIGNDFENISMKVSTADIAFLPSEDGACRVICYEDAKRKHKVEITEGVLSICEKDTRKWYEHIGFSWSNPMIRVYLPEEQYGALTIKGSTGDIGIPKNFVFDSMDISVSTGHITNRASTLKRMKLNTSTGDIFVEDVTVSYLDLSVSTGKVKVTRVRCSEDVSLRVTTGDATLTILTCKNLSSQGSTGELFLQSVIASESYSLERSTGDIQFDGCDASEIYVKTDTGKVTGTLLSEKIFFTETDTGKVNTPKSLTGGKCEIITDTGDIRISIAGK